MANFFNFYPVDGSATITEIPAAEVTAAVPGNVAADDFGCFETQGGLYVPTLSAKEAQEVQNRINGYKLANKNFAACMEICGVDVFGDKI